MTEQYDVSVGDFWKAVKSKLAIEYADLCHHDKLGEKQLTRLAEIAPQLNITIEQVESDIEMAKRYREIRPQAVRLGDAQEAHARLKEAVTQAEADAKAEEKRLHDSLEAELTGKRKVKDEAFGQFQKASLADFEMQDIVRRKPHLFPRQ
ncbi:MAG: hypothetical protein NTW19_08970 [Planctomycetota bacterium]|nr:hypothetical protein [Planctomycetota bacterium]